MKKTGKRKFLASFLAVMLLLCAFPLSTLSKELDVVNGETKIQLFDDVTNTHWAYDHIKDLSDKSIINGYTDGTFRPGESVTRAHAAVMIVNALGLDYKGKTPNFTDVSSKHWAAEHIATAQESGIINGYKDGTFRPGDNITRAQIAVMIANAFEIEHTGIYKDFSDINEKYWAYKQIEILSSNGIINGYSDGSFKPAELSTRAHFSVILSNAIAKDEERKNFIKVLNVRDVDDIAVDFGGTYELPSTVEVVLSNDSVVEVAVNWDDSKVDIYKIDTYEVMGILDVSELENVAKTDLTATINVVVIGEVKEEVVQENHVVFSTIQQEDNTLLLGETEILQEGANGYDEVTYSVIYVNEVEVERTETSRVAVEPIPKIIKVGTRVDVESILLSHAELILTEGENISLSATVLPENATNKKLLWSSSNESIVTVNEEGVIQALSAGEAKVAVTDISKNITSAVIVTVKEPTIDSIENITTQVIQFDDYTLPTTVTALMSNGTNKKCIISWENDNIDTSILGTQYFEGTVEDYDLPIILTITVEKYDPQLLVYCSSMSTVNDIIKGVGFTMKNNGSKEVNIEKIEIYEKGILRTTYTPQTLSASGIETVVLPEASWGISIQYKIGIWTENSYAKFYLSANNTTYEYEISLE